MKYFQIWVISCFKQMHTLENYSVHLMFLYFFKEWKVAAMCRVHNFFVNLKQPPAKLLYIPFEAVFVFYPYTFLQSLCFYTIQRIYYIDKLFPTLLCEPALLVKGKSFVTLYTDFSFKQLKENALVKEFSSLLKGKSFRD